MKNIKIKLIIFFLAIILSEISTPVYASLDLNLSVHVPASCTAIDTDNVIHTYSESDSYLAICALEKAIEDGSLSDVQLSNQFPSLGLFVTSIGGVVADPNSQYWAIYKNGNFADSGIATLSITTGDIIMFQLHDFSDNNLEDQVTINIESLIATTDPITLSNISITTPASKLDYIVGDILDISDLIVTGTYSDNSTKIETITLENISGFDSTAPIENQILTITVEGKTTTYTININPKPAHIDLNLSVHVPASCTAIDTDNVIHTYSESDSYLAICALEKAIEDGSLSDVQLSNQFPSLGLFVTSIGGVVADPNSQYWAIYKNGNFADSGIATLSITTGDIIMFQLHDFSDNNLEDQVTINIESLINSTTNNSGNSGGGGFNPPEIKFNMQDALDYLESIQGVNGSFGESDLYTDWVAIAYGAGNISGSSRDALLEYLNSNNKISSLITDNERRAMALLSLDKNPYSFNEVNYIEAIVDEFDGVQFGDVNLINDDIFALIPLANSGYDETDDIIIKTIDFLITKQQEDGSWEKSIDLTAASIQALKSFDSLPGVSNALTKAKTYLINTQENDGGWGNIFSTSWVIQTEKIFQTSFIKNGKSGMDYLATQQYNANNNGALLSNNENLENIIWATSYAIPAGFGKTWHEIMQSVLKQKIEEKNDFSNTSNIKENTTDLMLTENANLLIEPEIIPSIINTPPPIKKIIATKPLIEKNKESLEKTHITELNPNLLTTNIMNALPQKDSNNSQNIPIILGTISGFILLYGVSKLFI